MMTLILTGLLRGVRTQRSLVLENLALRHQLVVLRRTASRPRLRISDRLLWALLSHLWRGWTDAISVVQPATVIRWQRSGFKLFWTRKSRRHGPGRPAVAPEVCALIRRTPAPRGRRRLLAWDRRVLDRLVAKHGIDEVRARLEPFFRGEAEHTRQVGDYSPLGFSVAFAQLRNAPELAVVRNGNGDGPGFREGDD